MTIKTALAYGMCFGVRDALATTEKAAKTEALTVLGQMVHNPIAIRRLERLGVISGLLTQTTATTQKVLITAHGAADQVRQRWKEAGHQIIDTTCPLVRRAHTELQRLVAAGYYPVVVGQASHVEVRGLIGDFPQATVIEQEEDLVSLPQNVPLGIIAQTTQPLVKVQQIVTQIKRVRPEQEIRFCDTVCQPTKDRQSALIELCPTVELVVVVGGRTSNNTRQLASTARALGCLAHQIEHAGQLQACWFREINHVGVTAGTSTLEETFQEVVEALHRIARAKELGMAEGFAR